MDKDFGDDKHYFKTAVKVSFNGKEDYTVTQVRERFKQEICSNSCFSMQDFENRFEELALPNKDKNKPAKVLEEFTDELDQPCTLWKFAKNNRNSKGRYFTLYLLTERNGLPDQTNKDVSSDEGNFLNKLI